MKNIAIALLLIISIKSYSQTDSTKVKGVQMQAKLIAYLTPNIAQVSNDSLFQVYIDLRNKFRISSPPAGNTLVTIDSIPTVELANLYNYTLSNSDGMGVSALMKARLTTARAANTYLDRLCTAFETFWTNKLNDLITAGLKMYTGK